MTITQYFEIISGVGCLKTACETDGKRTLGRAALAGGSGRHPEGILVPGSTGGWGRHNAEWRIALMRPERGSSRLVTSPDTAAPGS